MTFIKNKWYKVAAAIDEITFGANDIAAITFDNKQICVAKNDGKLYAFEYYCPHAGGVMAHGCLTGNAHVICPVHDISFDMVSGDNVSGEGFQLQTWPVKQTTKGIFIGVRTEVGFWEWLMK